MAALQAISLIREKGGDGEALQFDITRLPETKDAVNDVASRFKSIDVLVNNAGVTADGLLLMMSEKNWNTVVDTSLKGFFNITKPVLKCMVRKKYGSCRTRLWPFLLNLLISRHFKKFVRNGIKY